MKQLPRLEQDIRKLPSSTNGVNNRVQENNLGQKQANARHTSISVPSTINGHSNGGFSPVQGESSATSVPEQLANPPLSAFRKKKKKIPKRRRLPAKELKGPSPPEQRYWNEFDNGSEGEGDEPYTIFVDPNSLGIFPGLVTVSEVLSSLSANSKASREKIQTWLTPKPRGNTAPDERSLLINSDHSPTSPTMEDSSESDNETTATVKQRSYSTMASDRRSYARSSRESILFRCSLGSFTTAFVFVIVAAILVGTGRKKATAEVDVGVVICVAASLVFASMGVGCTVARRDTIKWVHRSVVVLTLVLVLVANAGVLTGLSHVQVLL